MNPVEKVCPKCEATYDGMENDCPKCGPGPWEPTEPDGNCELCLYKASLEWAMLSEEDRTFVSEFMQFLSEKRRELCHKTTN